MAVLSLKNVSKKIGSHLIVDRLNMSVEEGEVYGFLGPNGAGKTTTIRMIVGLIKPTKGQIQIIGSDVQNQRARALSQIGAIVENPETYAYMTGRKNLTHYARLAGLNPAETNKRIIEVVKLVKLTERINDKVKTYSLGMRQRLGLAQALLGNPKLLVLDEPTNGLDPAGMREFRDLIREIASAGIAVFVSSHLLSEIQLMCDRVAIIKEGQIITEQNVADLIHRTGRSVKVSVSDSEKACSVLKENDLEVKVTGQSSIQIKTDADKVPRIIKTLVSEDIDLFAVEPEKESLEDTFLELTNVEAELATRGEKHA